ncbi:MAG: sodium:calcium antiporter [Candidatus Puniceispirillaceae bacterium]
MLSPAELLMNWLPDGVVQSSMLIIAGIFFLGIGGTLIVPATTALGKVFKVSPVLIAILVIAGGTSAPELVVSVQAAFVGSPDIAIGNVIGSNMANMLLVTALAGLMTAFPLHFASHQANSDDANKAKQDLLVMVVLTIIISLSLMLLAGIPAIISLSLLLITGYYIYRLISRDSDEQDIIDEGQTPALWPAIGKVVGALLALLAGADMIVSGGVLIATDLGLSQSAIGLSIVAVGTSLPEIVAVIASAFHKRSDLALGNIIGSNIFNLGIILGLTGLIAPLPKSADITSLTIGCFALTTLIFTALILLKITLKRPIAFVFVGFYFAFLNLQI